MKAEPVVTVVIPTFNHAIYLKEALLSVCMQTYTQWEAIVINNYSFDNTIEVVNSFINSDSRIRLENFKNNGIIAASRNRGIALARGRYIAFLDSDDTWHTEKLEKCMEHFIDDVGLVCHGLRMVGKEERNVFAGPEKKATFNALLYQGNCITPSATIVVKAALESVNFFSEDKRFVTSEDYQLWVKLVKAGVKIKFVHEILGKYRIHDGNQSNSVLLHLGSVLSVINYFIKEDPKYGALSKIRLRRRYCTAYYGAARSMQRSGNWDKSLPLLFKGITFNPLNIKSYMALCLGLIIIALRLKK